MTRQVFQIEQGVFGLTMTDPGYDSADSADITDYNDFSCQITSGALNATPNVGTTDIPASWCEPASSTPLVGVTTYNLDVTFLQDPHIVAGISRFLFENDTRLAWFMIGLDNGNPPRCIGQCRVVAGSFGGEARVALTATISLPVEGKPSIEFGDATSSVVVGGKVVVSVGATVTDAEVSAAPTPTEKAALVNAKYEANPLTAWTTGQSATIGGFVTSWNGTLWVAGAATLAAREPVGASTS
jgi:hypothetical protein